MTMTTHQGGGGSHTAFRSWLMAQTSPTQNCHPFCICPSALSVGVLRFEAAATLTEVNCTAIKAPTQRQPFAVFNYSKLRFEANGWVEKDMKWSSEHNTHNRAGVFSLGVCLRRTFIFHLPR